MALTFEQWMKAVDRHIRLKAGLTSDDLADQTYRDWYDDEVTPEDAADMALEAEGFPE